MSPPNDYRTLLNDLLEGNDNPIINSGFDISKGLQNDTDKVSPDLGDDIGEVDSVRITRTYSKRHIHSNNSVPLNTEEVCSSPKKQKVEDSKPVKILQDVSNKGKKYKLFSLSVSEKKDNSASNKQHGSKKKRSIARIVVGNKSQTTSLSFDNNIENKDSTLSLSPLGLYSIVGDESGLSKINEDPLSPVPSTEPVTSDKYIVSNYYYY